MENSVILILAIVAILSVILFLIFLFLLSINPDAKEIEWMKEDGGGHEIDDRYN